MIYSFLLFCCVFSFTNSVFSCDDEIWTSKKKNIKSFDKKKDPEDEIKNLKKKIDELKVEKRDLEDELDLEKKYFSKNKNYLNKILVKSILVKIQKIEKKITKLEDNLFDIHSSLQDDGNIFNLEM